jgi:hypothetical protein
MAHFSSLNEQIFLKLLVGVTPKIEANLNHFTDSINISSSNLGVSKYTNMLGSVVKVS